MGTTIDTETFIDLDFADDVALLTEIFSGLLSALDIMHHEAKSLGVQLNCKQNGIFSSWRYG